MYKVDNAIIMAAGLSSRFLPLSLEKPKSLWKVKGEVLLERQIKQLIEVGITDITVVVGYKADKFEYLVDKFNVELVLNKDYYRYNNTSSLMPVLDKLKNTYVCSSDNYFVHNPFKKELEHSVYPIVYNPDAHGEYFVEMDKNNKITSVETGTGEYAMIGQVFFSEEFSKKFKVILEEAYKDEDVRVNNYWEDVYINNIKDLDLYGELVDGSEILEFDSLEELQEFDKDYLDIKDSTILNNIKRKLNCEIKDIEHIVVKEKKQKDALFTFEVDRVKFAYFNKETSDNSEDFVIKNI